MPTAYTYTSFQKHPPSKIKETDPPEKQPSLSSYQPFLCHVLFSPDFVRLTFFWYGLSLLHMSLIFEIPKELLEVGKKQTSQSLGI